MTEAGPPGWNQNPPPQPGFGAPPSQPAPGGFQPPTPGGFQQPPGGFPPPGSPTPAPQYGGQGYPPSSGFGEKPKKRRTWLWVLLGIVLLLVVGIGGCTYVIVRAAAAPIDAANEWIALVDEGRYEEAYDALCPATQASNERSVAVATLNSDFGVGIDDYSISSYNNSNGVVDVSGTVNVGGATRSITLAMGDVDGWKVCGYDVG